MNSRMFLFVMFLLVSVTGTVVADAPYDSVVVGYWSFDEKSGSTIEDASPFRNDGYAYGTSQVAGRLGNGLLFNGTSDYITIPDPANGSLDFSGNDGFRIECSFRTADSSSIILRKGLAPNPGYMLAIRNGRLQGMIGNREDGPPPDMLLSINSEGRVDDMVWHDAVFIRDREAKVLRLYIDGVEAAAPVADPIHFSLAENQPLIIGCWEYLMYADYFQGKLDEVRITKFTQQVDPSAPLAVWHMDDPSGDQVADSSPRGNNGVAYMAPVVPGAFGSARAFDGFRSFVQVQQPSDNAFDFGPGQSFTIGAWFQSTAKGYQVILRKGLAPLPGYELHMVDGKVGGTIGNREDGTSPDTLITVTSIRQYNDGKWHSMKLIRDRERGLLVLLVDDQIAADPAADNFPYVLANSRPLTMGRWESQVYPGYFTGNLDEVSILPGAMYPSELLKPLIVATPAAVDFGKVAVGLQGKATVVITNQGIVDTLRITAREINDSHFTTPHGTINIGPRKSAAAEVTFTPTSSGPANAILSIVSNDSVSPVIYVSLHGEGAGINASPTIGSVRDIPGDNGKRVRIEWFRSLGDAGTASVKTTEYSIWRRVDVPPAGLGVGQQAGTRQGLLGTDLWDYIETVPAARFDRYSYVAPTLYDSTGIHIPWSVFKIGAHDASGALFFSSPDSGYSVNNTAPHAPGRVAGQRKSDGSYEITWERSADADVAEYLIARGTDASFVPDESSIVGSTGTVHYVDHPAMGTILYYRVAARDSAGNQSPWTASIATTLTSVGNMVGSMPQNFGLSQGYPNPFNPSVVLRYELPHSARIAISIYDLLGRLVATLVQDEQQAGYHHITWNAGNAASGIYLVRMGVANEPFTAVRKVLLVK